jgi:uncharacterized RmlC-like cupin family protein
MPDSEGQGELGVRVVGPEERDTRTAQTPGGLKRWEAVSSRLTGSQRMWMGYAVLEPGGMTGVHHHGESETAIYVLSGVTRWWWATGSTTSGRPGPGTSSSSRRTSCTGSRTRATPSPWR